LPGCAAVAGIRLRGLLGVLGGPDYEVTYPNGDLAQITLNRFSCALLTAVGRI
jgi:hypothetical protein